MNATCAKKCFTKYSDSDLSVGEMTCIDRCAGKYMSAMTVVGKVLGDFEKNAKQAHEAAQGAAK